MQTSMSCVKINTLMNTQLVYPELIREHLERLYEVAKSNYVYKNRKKFNFMKFGHTSEEVLKQQFETIFKDYRELHKDIDTLKDLHCLEPWQVSEFKRTMKIYNCLVALQKIIRLYLFSDNPVQVDYNTVSWLNFFFKNEAEIRSYIKNV
jgi:hypothetical protein